MQPIAPRALAAWLDENESPLLLDVREPWEVAICSFPGAVHIPMREIPARLDELDGSRPLVCACHHGGRSAKVALFLEQNGFERVFNLVGGIDAWACEVDTTVNRY